MTTVHDVPAEDLIDRLDEELRSYDSIEPPEWAEFSKTGQHKELPPEDPDWWYTRVGAILRKVYIDGPVGVSGLRSAYGGKERRGMQPAHQRKGSGSIVREALQQLEEADLIEQKGSEGRQVSPEGRSFLDELAGELAGELSDEIPGLERY